MMWKLLQPAPALHPVEVERRRVRDAEVADIVRARNAELLAIAERFDYNPGLLRDAARACPISVRGNAEFSKFWDAARVAEMLPAQRAALVRAPNRGLS